MRLRQSLIPVVLVLMLALAGCTASETETDGGSTFGLSMEVPDNWMTLTRQEIKENPDLFEDVALKGIPHEVMQPHIDRLKQGKVDLYLRTADTPSSFTDNVNVMKVIQRLPDSDEELAEVCGTLPDELAMLSGRAIEMYTCERAEVAGKRALSLEFDGVVQGTRSMQYQVAKSANVSLIITATSREETLTEVRSEFQAMIASARIE